MGKHKKYVTNFMVQGVYDHLTVETINKCYFDDAWSDDIVFVDKVRKENDEGQRLWLAEHLAPP